MAMWLNIMVLHLKELEITPLLSVPTLLVKLLLSQSGLTTLQQVVKVLFSLCPKWPIPMKG